MRALTFESSDDDYGADDDDDDDGQSVGGGMWCENHSPSDNDGRSMKGKRSGILPFNTKPGENPAASSLTESGNTNMVVTNPGPSNSPPRRESRFAKVKVSDM